MGEECLLFLTNFTAERRKIDIRDGKCIIDDKEFIIDRVQPFLLMKKRLFKTTIKPIYLLKWDKIEPVNYVIEETEVDGEKYGELKERAVVRSLVVKFPEKGEKDVLPHYLRETHDMRYLKHMKKYATGEKGFGMKFQRWWLIPISFIISGGIMFLLYYTGIFK
jgi:hypothetical protein